MIVQCCPVEVVIELPVRVYPAVVYIPEESDDSIALVVQQSQASAGKRMMGIVLPHHPSEEKFPRY